MSKQSFKKITAVRTRIRNRRQLVIFELEGGQCVFLRPGNVRQNVKIDMSHLELLIGSSLRLEFYDEGEIMFDGRLCTTSDLIVKDYFFELVDSIEELKIKRKSQLLPFKMIYRIFNFVRSDRDCVGMELEDGTVIFMSAQFLENHSKLIPKEFSKLKFSYVLPEFFKPGDTFSDGTVVRTDSVLKFINLRFSINLEISLNRGHASFDDSLIYYDGNEYSSDSSLTPEHYGYRSWQEMCFYDAFEGEVGAWDGMD